MRNLISNRSNKHQDIINLIKKRQAETELVQDLETLDDFQACRLIFENYHNDGCGMKLTPTGFSILSKLIAYYSIKMPENFKILTKHIVFMKRYSNYPWFIDNITESFISFDANFAMRLKLVDGDLSLYMKSLRITDRCKK